ncbi:hypothetical protein CBL_09260 [Carabus blaptoides fortunei]
MDLLAVYDEHFNQYLQLAKVFIKQLKSKEDREICIKWIKKLLSLKTQDASLKRNRNEYLKYMLTILQRGNLDLLDDYPKYDDMYQRQVFEKKGGPTGVYHYKWSADKKLYTAAKPVPGQGMLIYMAATNAPFLGWDHPNEPKP